jgi:hypothetical protein
VTETITSTLEVFSVYTYTLSSGNTLQVDAHASFGEVIVAAAVFSLVAVVVLQFCFEVAMRK